MKPERGEIWENIHTKTKTKILDRIFFNIHHEETLDGIGQLDSYTHYKTFQKHWVKLEILKGE